MLPYKNDCLWFAWLISSAIIPQTVIFRQFKVVIKYAILLK